MKNLVKQNEHVLGLLKTAILDIYGVNVETHKDCIDFSIKITDITNRKIGVSTLRRFLGMDNYQSPPSDYTLNTLAIYGGYDSLDEFITKVDGIITGRDTLNKTHHITSKHRINNEIYNLAKNISDIYLKEIRSESQLNFDTLPINHSILNFINNFIESPFSAASIHASALHGKSTSIARVVDSYYLKSEESNTAIFFINSSIFFDDKKEEFDLQGWFDTNVIEKLGISVEDLIKSTVGDAMPNILLIIDSKEKITESGNIKCTKTIADFLDKHNVTEKIKLLIVSRQYVWENILEYFELFPKNRSIWYNFSDRFMEKAVGTIFHISTNDMLETLNMNKDLFDDAKLKFMKRIIISNDYYSTMRHPAFFRIFLTHFLKNDNLAFNDLELYKDRENEIFFNYNDYDSLTTVLDKISIEILKTGIDKPFRKSALYNDRSFRTSNKAYDYLLETGLIEEYKESTGRFQGQAMIRFCNNETAGFTIINTLFDEGNPNIFSLSDLFVSNTYSLQTRLTLLPMLIKFAFFQEKYQFILELKKFFDENISLPMKIQTSIQDEITCTVQTVSTCFRHNQSSRESLINNFVIDPFWQSVYFESYFDIDFLVIHHGSILLNYLIYRRDTSSILFGHSLLVLRYILANNNNEAKKHLEVLNNTNVDFMELDPFIAGLCFCAKLTAMFFFEHNGNHYQFEIISISEKILNNPKIKPDRLITFLMFLLIGTNLYKRYDISIRFFEEFINKHEINVKGHDYSPDISLLYLATAAAYMETGELIKSRQILEKFSDNCSYPSRNFFEIYYLILRGKQSYFSGNVSESISYLNKAKEIAEILDFILMKDICTDTIEILIGGSGKYFFFQKL